MTDPPQLDGPTWDWRHVQLARALHGLSLEALSARTGLPKWVLARIEARRLSTLRSTREALSHTLNVPECLLFPHLPPLRGKKGRQAWEASWEALVAHLLQTGVPPWKTGDAGTSEQTPPADVTPQ